MLKFKDIIKDFSHLRFVYDNLAFCTSMGKERLLNSSIITKKSALEAEFDKVESMSNQKSTEVKNILSQFRDIRGTFNTLANNQILNEIDLFEIKYFAYYVTKLHSIKRVEIEPLDDIFNILDPNGSGVVNFYIYDIYDSELAELRKQEKTESRYIAISRREEVVREQLTKELKPHVDKLKKIIERIAEIDLLIAKSDFAEKNKLVRPTISDSYGKTSYKSIFPLSDFR